MIDNYIKRAFGIFQQHGFLAVIKAAFRYMKYRFHNISQWIIYYSYKKIRHKKYKILYRSSFKNVDDLIYIDPNKIEYAILSNSITKPGTFIIGGEWDMQRVNINTSIVPCYSNKNEYREMIKNNPWRFYRFENWDHYNSFSNHFEQDVPWQETDFYTRLTKNPDNNSGKYSNIGKINNRLDYNDELYKSIKSNGYIRQNKGKELKNNKNDELGVGITRTGEIIYVRNGACHRFTIARILGIGSIPAKVKLRHKEWQELRQDIYNNGLSDRYNEDLRNHPDLQDAVECSSTKQ